MSLSVRRMKGANSWSMLGTAGCGCEDRTGEADRDEGADSHARKGTKPKVLLKVPRYEGHGQSDGKSRTQTKKPYS